MKDRSIMPRDRSIVSWEEHDSGDDCWCAPELYQACPECVEEFASVAVSAAKSRAEAISVIVPNADPSCWRCCGRGYVDPYDHDAARLIVHRQMLSGTS